MRRDVVVAGTLGFVVLLFIGLLVVQLLGRHHCLFEAHTQSHGACLRVDIDPVEV